MITQEERESLMRAMEMKELLIFPFELPTHKQLGLKKAHDGFNLTELAALLGCGVSTLSEIINAKRPIPYKYRQKIENYLYHEMYCDKKFVGMVDQ